MAGLRIHHPELRDCKLLVPHPGDARTGRKPKDYHITIDSEGNAIVSETVWMRLQQARASNLSPHAFLLLNEVADPPMQMVGDIAGREVRTFRQTPEGVSDAQLLSIAQKLAPPGLAPRITTSKKG